ncbi:hypothetical protein SAMN04488245_101149 [Alloyangia pacifica]|uniref:Uncharacterized protein n=1 Tax=Alloyangia pacifica TaxID=311180 RepID=A0A1I6QL81_9RHOB|nr:hypothetical protein SAMN04488245_101149 [Alloyangia pacifica]SFS53257.1 hypothetical protein SAMN04488050_102150 [Alloyangia pacifica]
MLDWRRYRRRRQKIAMYSNSAALAYRVFVHLTRTRPHFRAAGDFLEPIEKVFG